ncbi:bifunctional copper resistance protein CopD/cytochrome c oxidase assembly protein [Corynebacterium sp. ES2794-CONJ1]|uniref:bifunctional copper resistance protein CopD/cytochrome c oxidase assembly protein n=1 Tax=unclassified Corynebacterium TaxID=2624378 RepID=UPI00216A39AF|nr:MULTISPECIES: bifunctional copper resistance protein CopD/cytochrome c oxidase assembly protein [unclassified Corynebacterium]MCS4490678.1 bifunctional copper resistance protein CopD/cytochrome c oxidase assembly protein [Corynebacterium sp. ES2775-CONJ]MCS4492480.1 bifunctional copper resistance protein CopD/cytochrome c oxidase assembly protein [Corynebacterium sp. ES2715-CONJ3]MCS4532556.1 bifunctional copper resistance protein CopD/cytochrome c oxidase assembly protein [Corynebacterium sp
MQEQKSGAQVRPMWPLYVLCFSVAGLIGAVIAWGFLSESLAALGIPDPGPATTAGFPFLRAAAWFLAALSSGSFLFSAFLLSPRKHDLYQAPLTVDGVIAARTGMVAAWCFSAVALVMVPMVLSDISGQPFIEALRPANWPVAISQVAESQAWLGSAVIAALVGIAAFFSKNWRSQPLLCAGALLIVLPLGLEGHSAAGGDHDYGTNSLLWHLLFMQLWVGGLMALIAHGRRLGPQMVQVVGRYSHIALVSVIMLALSGFINAAIRVRPEHLLTTGYGRVIVAKAVLIIALALFGFWHRQRTIPALRSGDHTPFLRVAIGEAVVMAATIGVAISLGRTPPPPPRVFDLSPMALEMGYDLTVKPTIISIWTVWRFDIMFSFFGLVLIGLYLWGLVRAKKKQIRWSKFRTMWWMLGAGALVICMSSGIGLYMPALFSMHMVTHMLLSMVIPVCLVLGAPLRLLMSVTEPGHGGVREWVEALLQSRILTVIMYPAVNTIQFTGFFYVLYITPWYDYVVSEHAGHLLMNWVFLISGYIFYWEMIGEDPKPRENSVLSRLLWLVFAMPFDLYFGVYLMQLSTILAEDFYASLNLPWGVDLMHDQNVGGGIAWGSGAFPLIIVFGALFRQWLKEDRKQQHIYDEKADQDDDADLEAYNQMLASIRTNDGKPQG